MIGPDAGARSILGWARLAGALFAVSIVAGGFGEFVAPTQLTVPGDATATAHNIVASDFLLRAGFASYLVEALCDTALTALLFVLLRPVGPVLALLALLFRIMATATFAFAELFYFVPTAILAKEPYLKTFSGDQLNALALLSMNIYSLGGLISLVFYGTGLILLGYLTYRSTYLPAALGVLMMIAGAGFAARTFVTVLAPSAPAAVLQLPTIVTILLLGLWLLVRGVDVPRWEAKAMALQRG